MVCVEGLKKMKPYERINEYLDFYESLLTEKQKEIMNLYYQEDYSLGEIAANLKVTRSAVQNNIKRSEKILEDYETKLHLAKRYHKRKQLYACLIQSENEETRKLGEKLIESEDEV